MRRLPGQALRIGVAVDAVALVRTSRWGAPELLAERRVDGAGPQALAPVLGGLLSGAAAGWPVSVVLSDELARMWLVTPPPACSRMADLEAAAALRYQHLYGAAPAGWKIAADWNAADPFLAAAVPDALLSVLVHGARERRCHLVEIVPHFVASLNQWRRSLRPGAWFGALRGGELTLAVFDGHRLAAVRPVAVPEAGDREWLDSQVAREALRLGLARPQQLLVAGAAPADWASSEGRLKFACRLLDAEATRQLSSTARLAFAGSAA